MSSDFYRALMRTTGGALKLSNFKAAPLAPYAITGFSLLAFFLAWEGYVFFTQIPDYLLPAPHDIAARMQLDAKLLWKNTLSTMETLVKGILLASACGFALGFAFYYMVVLRLGLLPMVLGLRSIPEIAFAPLYLVWFGFGEIPKIIITAQVAFFPIFLNTLDGFRNVDRDAVNFLRSLNASELEILRKVRLPAALASVMTGLRTTLVFGLLGAVVGEWIVVDKGLGVIILAAGRGLQTTMVFEVLVILSSLGLLLYMLSFVLERTVFKKYIRRSKS